VRNGGVNELVQILVAERRQHFAGFNGVGADVAADEPVGMGQEILRQKHPVKIKFARRKSELDLLGQSVMAGKPALCETIFADG
jgi:hypothetical protein